MGKRIVNVLTVCLVLLFALSSCSLDSALDALSGNVYGKLGVKFDNPAADATKETIDETDFTIPDEDSGAIISTVEGDNKKVQSVDLSKISGFTEISNALNNIGGGSAIIDDATLAESIANNGLLTPMDSDAKDEFNTNIANTLLNSDPSVKEEFVSYLGENAADNKSNAAKNSLSLAYTLLNSAVANNIPDSVPANLKDTINSIKESIYTVAEKDTALTNAELTQVQMVTNMVTSVTKVIVEINNDTGSGEGEGSMPDLSQPPYSDAIDDLTVLSQVSAEMSSAGVSSLNIPDVSSIISSLPGMFTGGSSSSDDDASSGI